MTALKFYLNDDGLHEWANLRYIHGDIPVALRCSTVHLIPFIHSFEELGAAIDDVVIEYYDGSEITLNAASKAEFELYDGGDYEFIQYNGEALQGVGDVELDTGLARFRIEMDDSNDFYSDYFEICTLAETCESNPQLLANSVFDDWTGDDPDDWDVTGEDVNNYITEDAAGVAEIITIDSDTLTIGQDDIMEIGEIYECEVILSAFTSGWLKAGGVLYSPEIKTAATYTFYVVATDTTFSLYTNTTGATSLKLTSCTLTKIDRCEVDNYFNIWLHAYCDLPAPARILYQTGYENHHAFDTLPVRPETELNIEGEMDEYLNESIFSIANKKTYTVQFLGGESLFDMLSILKMHEYIYVSWPGKDRTRAYNVEFEAEWVDDYYCVINLRFTFENLKKGGCCENFTLE